jgi:STE24 endopeptidase
MFKKISLIFLLGLLFLLGQKVYAQTDSITPKTDTSQLAQTSTFNVTDAQKQERLAQALKYQKAKNIQFFLDQGYAIVLLVLFLSLGLSFGLRRFAQKFFKKRFWVILLYSIIFFILVFIFTFPSNYYSFSLEHKFGLSNQNFSQWLGEGLKGLLIMVIFGIIIIEVIYAALRHFSKTWWIWISALSIVFAVVLVNLAPVLIMPLFNKYTPLQSGEIRDKLVSLSQKAGVKVENIYLMDMSKQTKKANAMFTGLGSTKRIVLGDNLVKEYTPDEIEVVIAHEMGHNVMQHIWKGILFASLILAVGFFIIHISMGGISRKFRKSFKIESKADIAGLPLFLLIFVIYGLITMPILPTYSRHLERQSDKYALDLTQNKEAFISAMQKLGYQNLSDPNPSPIIEFLLYDHPSDSKRIKFAEEYQLK